jgi:hypothetical protein
MKALLITSFLFVSVPGLFRYYSANGSTAVFTWFSYANTTLTFCGADRRTLQLSKRFIVCWDTGSLFAWFFYCEGHDSEMKLWIFLACAEAIVYIHDHRLY